MAEYIEREALMVALCKEIVGDGDYYNGKDDMQDQIRDMVSRFPAADVATVRHARWVSLRKGDWTSVYECSECQRKATVGCDRIKADEQVKRLYPYCHCGAKMDG